MALPLKRYNVALLKHVQKEQDVHIGSWKEHFCIQSKLESGNKAVLGGRAYSAIELLYVGGAFPATTILCNVRNEPTLVRLECHIYGH